MPDKPASRNNTFTSLVKLAMDGLVSFSSTPLRFVTWLGVFQRIGALLLGVWVLAVTIVEWRLPAHAHPTPRGWASTACLILIMSAAILVSQGIIGEYLSRIFPGSKRPTNVSDRPDRREKKSR